MKFGTHQLVNLGTGITLGLSRNNSWGPHTIIAVAVGFGASYVRHAPPDIPFRMRPGLAHFMEHMNFFYAVQRHTSTIRDMYASDINAVTTPSQTIWFAETGIDRNDQILGLLEAMLEVILFPFDEEPYSSKLVDFIKSDVHNERLYRWNSRSYWHTNALRDCLFTDALCRADILGSRDDVDKIDIEAVRSASAIIRHNVNSIFVGSTGATERLIDGIRELLQSRFPARPATGVAERDRPSNRTTIRQQAAYLPSDFEAEFLLYGVKLVPFLVDDDLDQRCRRIALDCFLDKWRGYPAHVWHYDNYRVHYGSSWIADGLLLMDPIQEADFRRSVRARLMQALEDGAACHEMIRNVGESLSASVTDSIRDAYLFWVTTNYLDVPIERLLNELNTLSGSDFEGLRIEMAAQTNDVSYVYDGRWADLLRSVR
jgi:hypothetical protein